MSQSDDRGEYFVKLLAQHERQLASYVSTFVYSGSDADDILQETKLALWRSFDQFQEGTNFGAWARKAAFNRILNFRRRKARESDRLIFSEACLERLAGTFEQETDAREERMDTLSDCVTKLSADHRKLLAGRYLDAISIEELAKKSKRSVQATYRVLSRIRLKLRDCVTNVTHGSHPEPSA